ncbi:hypothetical protein [Heyndrickxia oleronia]|uniref:hypothetical protein n=1 Tax=Heyndrickxia oleronia TaxID=38875 RepID=UPI000B1EC2E3|nr:hypothetical protein [Heyndrickxia oleronia]MCI1589437.1 hypothetical protein [Heyndrickxia oleronia]MCI1612667.1 hypothetical protein [Heyndrickxia oleronia]MCI1743894.1 hypothetical protein [Heyndrickxia oleronia]MCI1760563.1 hypothetical protein [Heyndrickxia oleronia]
MTVRINLYSFLLAFISILLFTFVYFFDFPTTITTIQPLYITFILSLITFYLSIIGLFSVKDWKSGVRSLLSIIISLGLIALQLSIIIF